MPTVLFCDQGPPRAGTPSGTSAAGQPADEGLCQVEGLIVPQVRSCQQLAGHSCAPAVLTQATHDCALALMCSCQYRQWSGVCL